VGASEQQWFCRNAGINAYDLEAKALHYNTDNRIAS
jgi:hypothetical protein